MRISEGMHIRRRYVRLPQGAAIESCALCYELGGCGDKKTERLITATLLKGRYRRDSCRTPHLRIVRHLAHPSELLVDPRRLE